MLLFCDERRKMHCTCILSGVESGIQSTDPVQANSFLKPNSYSESISRSRMRNRNCPFLNCIISRDDFWLMNKTNLRLRNSKKGITPVIATIILIAGTLVLALVVGAYTFGLFGSNVKTIQMTSAILSSGSATTTSAAGANFQMTFNNPGGSTNMSSLVLTSGGLTVTVPAYYTCSSPTTCTTNAKTLQDFQVPNSPGAQIDVYFGTALTSGTTYSYVITFTNGQSIPGTLVAQ